MPKIIDLRPIAAQMNVGEFQLYTNQLNHQFMENLLDFVACPGAVAEFTCRDGVCKTTSYILENNSQYRNWHQNLVADIRKQLSFDVEKVATAEDFANYTPEQLQTIALRAREQLKKATHPVRKRLSRSKEDSKAASLPADSLKTDEQLPLTEAEESDTSEIAS